MQLCYIEIHTIMAKEVLRWPAVIYFGTLQSCHRANKTALSQVAAKGTMS